MKHHYIKCESVYFSLVENGIKNFELRKNDRNYKKYDIVHLQETIGGKLTGRELPPKKIIYILYGGKYGLSKDYCILQLEDFI